MENIYFIIITSDYYHIFFLISNTGWIINSGLEIYGSCCLSFCFGSVFMCNEFSFCLSFFLFHSAAIWELWLFFQRGWLRFATQVLARLSNQIFRVEQRKVNKKKSSLSGMYRFVWGGVRISFDHKYSSKIFIFRVVASTALVWVAQILGCFKLNWEFRNGKNWLEESGENSSKNCI